MARAGDGIVTPEEVEILIANAIRRPTAPTDADLIAMQKKLIAQLSSSIAIQQETIGLLKERLEIRGKTIAALKAAMTGALVPVTSADEPALPIPDPVPAQEAAE
jgi:hypothetical protein